MRIRPRGRKSPGIRMRWLSIPKKEVTLNSLRKSGMTRLELIFDPDWILPYIKLIQPDMIHELPFAIV